MKMKNLMGVFCAAVVALVSFCAVGDTLTPANYSKKIEITLSSDAQTALGENTLTDFPVLVRLSTDIENFSYDDFKGENGSDLRFALEDGTLLSSEIDTWDETGTSLVWVKIPTLAASSKIIAYYGNANPDAMTSSDTWNSDYVAVYHLGESAVPLVESSGRASNFTTAYNSSGIGYQATGAIGKAVDFVENGKTRGFLAPDHDNLDGFSAMTLEIWTYQSAHGTYAIVDKRAGYHNNTSWQLYDNNGTSAFGVDTSSTGNAPTDMSLISPPLNQWNYQVHTYDSALSANRASGYLNGAFVKSATGPSGSVRAGTAPMYLGIFQEGDTRNFPGKVDELRISKVARSAVWIKQSYDTANNAAYFAYGSAEATDTSAVIFDGVARVAKDGSSFKVSATTTAESGTGALSIKYGTLDAYDLSVDVSSTAAPSTEYTGTLANLVADTSYKARFVGENDKGTITKAEGDKALYNGTLTIAAGNDADEKALTTPGTIIVSRADTYGDLVVNYTTGGTAVSNVNYVALPGTITITNGASSAAIEVYPLRARSGDHLLMITLADGLYFVDDSAKAATITIKTLVAPEGWNTWIAEEDGNASVAANWSEGSVPKAGDKILFDGRYSTANCEWDVTTTETSQLAAWSQTADYTGTITVDTEFPTYSGATFTCLYVSGDMTVAGGKLTHPQSIYQTSGDPYTLAEMRANAHYRLRIAVGGDFALASGGAIDASSKGYWRYATGKSYFGSHGGWRSGANSGSSVQGSFAPYGNPKEPVDIGSGTCNGTDNVSKTAPGGGAIYLTVGGTLTVDGAIAADGNDNSMGGSSAGSVYLKANAVSGSGSVHANAIKPTSDKEAGAGGRVAVVSTTTIADTLTLAATAGSAVYSGAGTVYVKDASMTHGKLLIAGNASQRTSSTAITPVTDEGDWTFDAVVVGFSGRLAVPDGLTLTLPNGLASVSSSDTSAIYDGILLQNGGLLSCGAGDQTMSGGWTFAADAAYAFPANLTLSDGARIGLFRLLQSGTNGFLSCDYTVNGDLTVDAGCSVDVSEIYSKSGAASVYPSAAHGGWSLCNNISNTYGSVFAPCEIGSSDSSGFYGCGALKLTVAGALTVNGSISSSGARSNSTYSNSSAAPGGSILVTAGTLSGTGTIAADGGNGKRDYAGGAGGGRVAVCLTDANATFPAGLKISAEGTYGYQFSAAATKMSSAGTVYLQDGKTSEKGGTILVSNYNKVWSAFTSAVAAGMTPPSTPIPARMRADKVADFRRASLVVTNTAVAEVSVDALKLQSLDVAADSSVDLAGHTLKVAKATLGGTKLAAGTYTSSSDEVAGYVTDSATGGQLIVKSGGIVIFYR